MASQPSELEAERDRLLRSIAKLEASNVELRAAIEGGDTDPVLRESIGENIVLLAKQKARASALADEVARLGGVEVGKGGGGEKGGGGGGEGVWL